MTTRKAKLFMNNRSQAVRLPKDFQFTCKEVYIRKEGDDVILSPRPKDWATYWKEGRTASPEFLDDLEDLPIQDRDIF